MRSGEPFICNESKKIFSKRIKVLTVSKVRKVADKNEYRGAGALCETREPYLENFFAVWASITFELIRELNY